MGGGGEDGGEAGGSEGARLNREVACGSFSTSSTSTARLSPLLASLTALTRASLARTAASSEGNVTSTITVTVACSRRWLVALASGWASAGAGGTWRRRRVVVTLYVTETVAELTSRSSAARIASTAARSAVSLVALADATENSNVV